MSDRVRICKVDELTANQPKRVVVEGVAVVVVKTADRVSVLEDRCSHADIRLSEGDIYPESAQIECWKHGSLFSLIDGMPQNLPATMPVKVFECTIQENVVWVNRQELTEVEL